MTALPANPARVFIALWPDEDTRAVLAQRRDAWSFPRSASIVDMPRLHVTLHFIGDVARERLASLAAQVGTPFAPFELTVDRATLWPHAVAVLEPSTVPPELTGLHGALAARLDQLKLPLDPRSYRPHVTLAGRAANAMPAPCPPVQWQVNEYRLMESTMGPGGGYTTLARYCAQHQL